MAKFPRTPVQDHVPESAVPESPPDAAFEPFTWTGKRNQLAPSLAEITKDISAGVSCVMQMLEVSDISRANGEQAVMSVYHSGLLIRMAITSLDLLTDRADDAIKLEGK